MGADDVKRSGESLEVTDWDQDGDWDVIFSDHFLQSQEDKIVLLEQSSEGFRKKILANVTHCAGEIAPVLQTIDFDGDSDLDIIYCGRFFERITPDEVIERPGNQSPLETLGSRPSMSVTVLDWDSDGDLDFLVDRLSEQCEGPRGCIVDLVLLTQQADGSFTEKTGDENPFQQGFERWHGWSTVSSRPQLVQQSGQTMLILKDYGLSFYEVRRQDVLIPREQTLNEFAGVSVGYGSEPVIVDWDSDGRMDLITVDLDGGLRYFKQKDVGMVEEKFDFSNVTLGLEPWHFSSTTPKHNRHLYLGRTIRLHATDWDQDGDVDLIVAISQGELRYFERQGSALIQRIGQDNPFAEISINATDLQQAAKPFFDWEPLLVQPMAVDWDSDGDLDLVLGPVGRYFERLRNGSLMEWPLQDSPFANVSQKPDEEKFQLGKDGWWGKTNRARTQGLWRFVDCDRDGDLDLVRLRIWIKGYRGFDEAVLQSCERLADGGLDCETNLTCGAGVTFVGDDFGLMDIGYWEEEAVLQVIQVVKSGTIVWKWDFCIPQDPCLSKGVCMPSGRCSCITGHRLSDCSGCQKGFYTRQEVLGVAHSCESCAGADESGTTQCSNRGFCLDDEALQRDVRRAMTDAIRGNGSCICTEPSFGGTDALGRSSCSEGVCPPGTREVPMLVDGNSSTLRVCQPCAAGFVSSNTTSASNIASSPGGGCTACPPGSYASSAGSSACSPCPAGSTTGFAGSSSCERCPQGRFAGPGSSNCQRCAPGSIAQLVGSSECTACSEQLFAVAALDQRGCIWDPVAVTCAVLTLIFAVAFGNLLVRAFCHVVSIVDISLQGEQVLITTQHPHRIMPWKSLGTEVTLSGTSIPWLDRPGEKPFRACASGSNQLVLLHPEGKIGASDTSSGSLRIPVRWAFTATGYVYVPLLVWLTLLAIAAVACARVARLSFSALAWGALIILAAVLSMQGYWYLLKPHTPLEKRRGQFTKGLEKRLRRCKRGPERAITAKQLVDFVEFFQGFILERTMYYVNGNIIQPLTKRDAVSFAEMVGPSPVAWFVSHYWGTALRHFADSIRKHAQLIHGDDWKTNAYWICTFSNNQWAVEEASRRKQLECNVMGSRLFGLQY